MNAIAEEYGQQEAVKIARFCSRTLDKMVQLATSDAGIKEWSQIREVMEIMSFEGETEYSRAISSINEYKDLGVGREEFKVMSGREAEKVRTLVLYFKLFMLTMPRTFISAMLQV